MKHEWQTKRLGDVATLQRGFDLPTQDRVAGKFPLVSSGGISDTHYKCAVPGPGVVTGRSGSIGNVFFVDEDFWPLNTVLYVKDFHGNLPRFVFYLLRKFDLLRFAGGTGVPTLNRNFVHDESVGIPPLPEQQRLVGILDDAFAGIAKARANAEKNLKNARDLYASYLDSVFTNGGENWVRVRIEEACQSIIDCVNKTAPRVDGPTPFKMIRTTNVRNGRVDVNAVNYVTEDVYLKWTRRQVPEPGDVILTREAPMGEVGILESPDKIFLGQRLVAYRANPAKLNNQFLLFAFQSHALQDQIHSLASGSTVQHMRVPDSKNLLMPLPDLKVQQEAVARLDTMRAETQRLESVYQRKLKALDDLKKSLLNEAFNGNL